MSVESTNALSSRKSADWTQHYYENVEHAKTAPQIVEDLVNDILTLAEKRTDQLRAKMQVLDVGCGPGQYALALAKHVHSVVAVEPYFESFQEAQRLTSTQKNLNLFNLPIEETSFSENSVDLVISLTTIEHMPEGRRSMEKVISYLKPGGILYLTAPNKLWPIECHYQLPFLSWLPVPLADIYLRLTKKGVSYQSCAYSRTYWGMKRLFKDLPCRVEFVVPEENASYIGCGQNQSGAKKWIRSVGIRLIRSNPIFWSISKGFIMVITKNKSDQIQKTSQS
jgi:2-polyprenyl-3-methyl-5-hydroxy-6-metoxy-1,4-benzoquinol methylase